MENTNQKTKEQTETLHPDVTKIIAIAQKVEKECPNYFELVFQAIINAIYKR